MDLRAERDVLERQRVARFDRRFRTGGYRVAHRDALRRQDVAALAVRVQNESEVRRAIRIVLEPFHTSRNAVLVALEVDHTVVALVTSALMPRSHASLVVAPAALRQR